MRRQYVSNGVIFWLDLCEAARLLIREHRLPIRALTLVPFPRSSRTKMDGEFFRLGRECVIRLRLHRYHRPRKGLCPGTVFATLVHELAHAIPHKPDHGPAFRTLVRAMSSTLRKRGYPVSTRLVSATYTSRSRR